MLLGEDAEEDTWQSVSPTSAYAGHDDRERMAFDDPMNAARLSDGASDASKSRAGAGGSCVTTN